MACLEIYSSNEGLLLYAIFQSHNWLQYVAVQSGSASEVTTEFTAGRLLTIWSHGRELNVFV